MESFETPWCSWCRLCAKEDSENSVNVHLIGNDQQITADKDVKLTLVEAMEKYFWVQSSCDDLFPKQLCPDCYSLVRSMIIFNEHAERVQRMYKFLVNNSMKNSYDLQAVRTKFNIVTYGNSGKGCSENKAKEYVSDNDQSTNVNCEVESNIEHESDIEHELDIKDENWSIESDHSEFMAINNEDSESMYKEEILYDEELIDDPNQKGDQDPFNPMSDDSFWGEDEEKTVPEDTINKRTYRNKNYYDVDSDSTSRHNVTQSKLTDFHGKERKELIEDFVVDVACALCDEKFELYSAYCEHMDVIHGTANMEKYCPICDRNLQTWYHLGRHMRVHMPMESRYPIKCPECENRYTTTALLEVHINHKHKKEKPFICEICGFTGGTKNSLTQHMYVHTDKKPFECEVCKKGFKRKARLNFHMDIHGPEKFICSICGLQLNSRATLKNHSLVHSDNKRHKCDSCGATFKRSKALKAHLLLHTGLKPYYCNFCNLSFSNRSVCRLHMRKVHPDEIASLEATGKKAFTENVPTLKALIEVTKDADNLRPVAKFGRTTDRASLNCNYCERRFTYRSTLKTHMKVKHPNAFALLEPSDSKTQTRNRSKLKGQKALSNAPTKPVPCGVCGRIFGNRKCWRNHMKRLHSDELAALEDPNNTNTTKTEELSPVIYQISECSTNALETIEKPTSPLDLTPSTTTTTNIQDLFILID